MSTRLYVEGGGDRKPLRTECRQAFREFLQKAGLAGRLPRIFASGGRQQAYDDFRHALGASGGDDFVVLLVDSEGPIAADAERWRHLKDRDGWDKPAGATDGHVHLMVQCMEAWFLADRGALARYFGAGFSENSLPRRANVEEVSKQGLERGLNAATRNSRPKGAYRKGRDSFAILADLDPDKVADASLHAKLVPEIAASPSSVTRNVRSRIWGRDERAGSGVARAARTSNFERAGGRADAGAVCGAGRRLPCTSASPTSDLNPEKPQLAPTAAWSWWATLAGRGRTTQATPSDTRRARCPRTCATTVVVHGPVSTPRQLFELSDDMATRINEPVPFGYSGCVVQSVAGVIVRS